MKKNSKALQATAVLIGILFVTGTILPGGIAMAQCAPPAGLFGLPLNQIPVPQPPALFEFVKDRDAARRLGKAFFWDMQAGSDGIVACATCHFEAGVDKRRRNTLHPGPDGTFQLPLANPGPNQTLPDTDFPFHLRDNPDIQASITLRDNNDVVGSQGVRRNKFTGINPGSAVDSGTPEVDPIFGNSRRVTGRNTPTNINAVFNFSNFWDGRANFLFNGVNPFGPLDQSAGVWFNENNVLVKRSVGIEMGSLASQATGPPLDGTEMSFIGRTFPELGRKMLSLTPLGKQMVHPADGVLGPLSNSKMLAGGKLSGLPGLNTAYKQMIEAAFQNNLWNSLQPVSLPATVSGATTTLQFSQMEANFSLFWGLAIELYEATLVSDQTPFDKMLGGATFAMTQQQCDGMNKFFGGAARCDVCHGGTETTNASVTAAGFITNRDHGLIELMPVTTGENIIYDNGFNNTSVRPTGENPGRAGTSPPALVNPLTGLPFPLGYSALSILQEAGSVPFSVPVLPGVIPATTPVRNNGAFKVPGLRNVELTAPYFHNGGDLTLEETVDFYTRGGNFPQNNSADLDVNIAQIGGFGDVEMAQMVAFMKSLTDERLRNHSAPFDHPELFIPEGDPEALRRIPARDMFGNAAPAFILTMAPLPAVTNKTSILVSGTKEGGATVQVKVNDGTATPAEGPPQATTWSATIGLAGGLNTVTATATDIDGNVVTVPASVNVIFSDGCLNCGGAVGIADAVRALQIAAGNITPTVNDLIHGDVAPLVNGVPNPDNRIGADDALLILKKVAGLVSF